ncbi:redoxin domain-containing protein [Vibrio penaeicida]|uniref:redoxin domain-containing protein n=1 Tax=Vibrio penaeicida TaxID=104609 RepID=UPI000CE9D56B|nr:redoxin domain-containing protein [Vibrio penaeicida]
MKSLPLAPELKTAGWLNSDIPIELRDLRGKVVVLHTFQMLCPGCVSHGLPQASKIHQFFKDDDVQVIGLHTVFEHHQGMQLESLKAFVHEYRLTFPIGIDAPSGGDIPITMAEYGLPGTPTLVLIDKSGQIRFTHHGIIEDMMVGKMITSLLHEQYSEVGQSLSGDKNKDLNCDEEKCSAN